MRPPTAAAHVLTRAPASQWVDEDEQDGEPLKAFDDDFDGGFGGGAPGGMDFGNVRPPFPRAAALFAVPL